MRTWFGEYLSLHQVHVSAVTIAERIRGYAILAQRAKSEQSKGIEAARIAYLSESGQVWPLDRAAAVVAGEIMALLPQPPTPPRQTHKMVESRQERLVRWRFDGMIAATALVAGMALIHNNPSDFESIRSAIEICPSGFPDSGRFNSFAAIL